MAITGSKVFAGGDMLVRGTSIAVVNAVDAGKDFVGTRKNAKGNLTLAANGAITLAAATKEDRQSGNAKTSGFTLIEHRSPPNG